MEKRTVSFNGEELVRRRTAEGLSQEALAEKAACDLKTIWRAEAGGQVFVATAGRIAQALKCNLLDLLVSDRLRSHPADVSVPKLSSVRTDPERWPHPQPVLDRFDADRKDENDRSIRLSDLQFIRRATPYFPRRAVENQIGSWLKEASSLAIVKLMGPAGAGKSRLALALCDAFHRQQWLAGFVTTITRWPDDWVPIRPTLVVVDYASSKSIGGLGLFDWLQRLRVSEWRREESAPRVGVVLIDRTDQGPLWSAWRDSPHASDFDELTLSIELSSEREQFDVIAQAEFRRRTGRPLSTDEREALDRVAERLHGQYRPLFALLSSAALTDVDDANSNGLNSQSRSSRLQRILRAVGFSGETGRTVLSSVRWSPELLVESILKAQLRQWRQAGVTDEHLDLLFEATISAATCHVRPGFVESADDIPASVYDSVASLSEPGETLGPIMPDLLGEFFVLMRLRGDAGVGQIQGHTLRRRSEAILEDTWTCTGTVPFLGLLLQDYLAWNPARGDNPAARIAEQVLMRAGAEVVPAGITYCAFAIAWRSPAFRDWAAWLHSIGTEHRLRFARAIVTGLANASLSANDVAACVDATSRIAAIHSEHGSDPVVREHLSMAWCATAVLQRDPSQRLACAERIQSLHDEYDHEVAVRMQLARAVCSCTFEEPDLYRLAEFVDRLDRLHAEFGEEPAVREQLANALCNACIAEWEPPRRDVWIERLQQLHLTRGQERIVRDPLVRALCHASTGRADLAKRSAAATALEHLHCQYPTEALTRELLAEVLYNLTVVEEDPWACLARADRIEVLHVASGAESAIRVHLAGAISNATAYSKDEAWVDARLETLKALHDGYGNEAGVRTHLAQALCNATAYGSAARRQDLANRIVTLHDAHGAEADIRECAARALYNVTQVEEDPRACLAQADRIEALHVASGTESVIRVHLAGALSNATTLFEDEAWVDARLETLRALHDDYGAETGVREHLARALCNATAHGSAARRQDLANRIVRLHDAHGAEANIREYAARALYNITLNENDALRSVKVVDQIDALYKRGRECSVAQWLAGALRNTLADERDLERWDALADRLSCVYQTFEQDAVIRDHYAAALENAMADSSDRKHKARLKKRLAGISSVHSQDRRSSTNNSAG